MVYMISYDLNKPGQDYTTLYEAIKNCGAWWHYLDSTWLVETAMTAEGLFSKLKPGIDQNDRVLVMKVGRDYSGWLSKDAWDWIDQRVR